MRKKYFERFLPGLDPKQFQIPVSEGDATISDLSSLDGSFEEDIKQLNIKENGEADVSAVQ